MNKIAFYIQTSGFSRCAVIEDVCNFACSTRPDDLRISLQMSYCDCFLPKIHRSAIKLLDSVACNNVKHIIMSKMKMSLLETLLFTSKKNVDFFLC